MVLENLDLVLLCLDETVDERCVTRLSHPPHHNKHFSMWYPSHYRSFRTLFTVSCGNGFNDDNFTSRLAQSEYGRDHHLRTDGHERILDDEGKDVNRLLLDLVVHDLLRGHQLQARRNWRTCPGSPATPVVLNIRQTDN